MFGVNQLCCRVYSVSALIKRRSAVERTPGNVRRLGGPPLPSETVTGAFAAVSSSRQINAALFLFLRRRGHSLLCDILIFVLITQNPTEENTLCFFFFDFLSNLLA